MELRIIYDDGVSTLMQTVIAERKKWISSALKSAGYWAQREIKKGIKSGSPGGKTYQQPISEEIRRRLEIAFGHNPQKRYPIMGKLLNATGYDKSKANEGVVTVGWLSASAVMIGSRQEKGFMNAVTAHVRAAFAAAGYPLTADKTAINVAARPTYGPMLPVVNKGAPRVVEMRIAQYLEGKTKRSTAKSNRRYKVYG